MSDELKAAYADLDDALRKVAALEGFGGVLTEWMVITAHHRYDEDGEGVTQVGRLLPQEGTVPHYRVLGLLDYTQAVLRAEVTEP